MNIEPSQRNINNLLSKFPLQNCEISAGWNSGGYLFKYIYFINIYIYNYYKRLFADTITIVA